jgi:hypothetical protein
LDEPPTASNDRPPVPVGMHRKTRWRRRLVRWAWWSAGGLVVASVLLAIFVHKGLLGISGIVFAVVTAYAMFRPSEWRRRFADDEEDDEDDYEDEVRERSADSPDRVETRPPSPDASPRPDTGPP